MKVFLFLLCVACVSIVQGQIQHDSKDKSFRMFDAGAAICFNASQVDGDNLAGFNKFGWNAGAVAHVNFDHHWSVSFELLYSQKGSRTFPSPDAINTYKLVLNYAEVPLLVNFNDKSRMLFQAGFAYGRLFSFKEIENGLELQNNADAFSKDEFSYIIGATVLVGEAKHFGVNLRFQGSITTIGKSANPQVSGLTNRLISLRGMYYF
ncbi:MAG: PorT family protein [Bacteroidetes bacterium]|nr:PorT family protein [Bacteroidota bacterium]